MKDHISHWSQQKMSDFSLRSYIVSIVICMIVITAYFVPKIY